MRFINFDPGTSELVLDFTKYLITIRGKSLDCELYDGLMEGRVRWLREAAEGESSDRSREVYIEQIIIDVTPQPAASTERSADSEA